MSRQTTGRSRRWDAEARVNRSRGWGDGAGGGTLPSRGSACDPPAPRHSEPGSPRDANRPRPSPRPTPRPPSWFLPHLDQLPMPSRAHSGSPAPPRPRPSGFGVGGQPARRPSPFLSPRQLPPPESSRAEPASPGPTTPWQAPNLPPSAAGSAHPAHGLPRTRPATVSAREAGQVVGEKGALPGVQAQPRAAGRPRPPTAPSPPPTLRPGVLRGSVSPARKVDRVRKER